MKGGRQRLGPDLLAFERDQLEARGVQALLEAFEQGLLGCVGTAGGPIVNVATGQLVAWACARLLRWPRGGQGRKAKAPRGFALLNFPFSHGSFSGPNRTKASFKLHTSL